MSRWNRRRVASASVAAALSYFAPLPKALPAVDGTPWGAERVVAVPPRLAAPEDRHEYDAYIPAALKEGQFDQYTCEFDAAWAICKTFGLDITLEDQVAIIGIDQRIEPYSQEPPYGFVVYGGDITEAFSGDYTQNFLARTTGAAMQKIFARYELDVAPVADRVEIEAALDRGALVWVKATVDFLPWQSVTWITPEGRELPGVLGNDHAVVVMGYSDEVVVIRDVLGPTSSNWNRLFEYEIPWHTFLPVWEAQGFDGLAVAPNEEQESILTSTSDAIESSSIPLLAA